MTKSNTEQWQHVKVTRNGPVTQLTFHSGGGPMVWNGEAHQDTAEAFAWLRGDRDTRVIVMTGAGDTFCNELSSPSSTKPWFDIWNEGRRFISDLVELDVPLIGVVNGPATVHAELLVLGDIVLAVPEATFADHAHMVRGVVPGDGAQVVWRNLLGASRSNYFLLTGEIITCQEAVRLGFVHEVLERDEILDRAMQLAEPLSRLPRETLAYARASLRHADRLQYSEAVGYGLALAGLSLGKGSASPTTQ